jgi:HEAT repeat protein
MKSTKKQLEERGFIPYEELNRYMEISDDKLLQLLNSFRAYDRTAGANITRIRREEKHLPLLCELLKNEKKLYTKIALSESIEEQGVSALKYLIPLLGVIGNNQHNKPDLIDLNKKSFPLPRDLAARIIIRIGEPALPYLEEVLVKGSYTQKLEAIDAIGHIAFNYKLFRSEKYLHNLLNENYTDELVRWKIVRAFQSFRSKEVQNLLKKIIDKNEIKILKSEAERSLNRIADRELKQIK